MKIITLLLLTYAMNAMESEDDIRKRLEKEDQRFSSARFVNSLSSRNDPAAYLDYCDRIAQIALNARPEELSNQEKLECLRLFKHREARKEITREMIEKEKIHPDNIRSNNSHPLEESIAFNDIGFTQYLLARGARLDKSQINMTAMTLEMAALFEEYYPPTPSRTRRR